MATAVGRYVRCWNCHYVLAYLLTPPYRIRCPRCKAHSVATVTTISVAVTLDVPVPECEGVSSP